MQRAIRPLLAIAASSFLLLSISGCSSAKPTCTDKQTACNGVCIDLKSAHDNCGACGKVCGTAEACVAGACATSCPSGQAVCGQSCSTLGNDNQNCGACGTACPSGKVCSNGACADNCATGTTACTTANSVTTCVDTLNDDSNCGACGTACGAAEKCVQSQCVVNCASPLTACTSSTGGASYCANTATDNANCGTCGQNCNSGLVCSNGQCSTSCANSLTTCTRDGGASYCANTTNDPSNCGTCGKSCGSGQQCVTGQCRASCGSGLTVCTGADAGADYCANFLTDNANCGACNKRCASGQSCQGGQCIGTCAPGTNSCAVDGGSSYCANFQTDTVNCGSCGNRCPSGEVCSNGNCATSCANNLGTCSADGGTSFCANLQTDNTHCGNCDIACPQGQACIGGGCQTTCGAGSTICATDAGVSYCANFQTDNINCGACFNQCQPGQVCSNGQCTTTCAAGLTTCDGGAGTAYCANGQIDPTNCGACGNACGAGEACQTGSCKATCGAGSSFCNLDAGTGYCASTNSDPNNCGTCGNTCSLGQVCNGGNCTATCSGTNSVICTPNDGGVSTCANTQADPNNCGGCGITCVVPANAAATCRAANCSYSCINGFTDTDGLASNGCEGTPTLPLGGLKLWLRSDQGVTVDGSNRITNWADQSGAGNNVAVQSIGNAPTLVANVVNGLPVARFRGSRMVGATAGAFNFGTGDLTWIYVARTFGTFTSDRNRVFGTLREGAPYEGITAGFRTQPGGTANHSYGMFRSPTGTEIFPMSPVSSLNTWVTAMGRRASGVASYYRDWVLEDSQAANFNLSGNGYLTIGAERLTGSEYHNGDIAEILIYDRALSQAEVDKVRAYLTAKYHQWPKNCFEIRLRSPAAPSGIYTVDPAGGAPFRVYCDMNTDNGGWTKILHLKDAAYTPTTGAVGDIATGTIAAAAKLTDAQINALRGAGNAFYRIVGTSTSGGAFTPVPFYMATNRTYVDTTTSFNLVSTATRVCSSATLAGCTFTNPAPASNWLDTLAFGTTANDCTRIFTDYTNQIGCFPSNGTRCFSSGASCNHTRLDGVTMMMRPIPKSCLEIKQLTGTTTDGNYSIDINGTIHLVYCDMNTAGGGWTQVLDQDVNVSPGFQSRATWAAGVNVGSPNSGQYSILHQLDYLKGSSNFEFAMDWPNVPVGSIRWTQFENPLNYVRGQGGQAQPSVLNIIMNPTNQTNDVGATFTGLAARTSGGETLLAGDQNSAGGYWWWAIGTTTNFNVGIPTFYTSSQGGSFLGTTRARLWVR